MNEEFEKYIKKIKRMNMIYYPIIYIISTDICIGLLFALSILIDDVDSGFIKFVIGWFSILLFLFPTFFYFRYKYKKLKNEHNKGFVFPFEFPINYDDLSRTLKNAKGLTKFCNFENITFYDFMERQSDRYIVTNVSLYNISNFNKQEYSSCYKKYFKIFYQNFKRNIKYASRFNLWQRFNIIFIEKWNNDIDKFINSFVNKDMNMREFKLYAVIYQNQIIIKPLYGGDDNFALYYYHNCVKKLIKLINYSNVNKNVE